MVGGSAILLLLIFAFGITTVRKADEIYADISSANNVIRPLEVQLRGLRADLYLSGIYVRDQLLDSRSEEAQDQRGTLREVRMSIDRRLVEITRLVPEEHASAVEDLRSEISAYWESLAPVMEDPAGSTAAGYAALRRRMLSRRDSVLVIAQRIGDLNEYAFQRRYSRVNNAQRAFLTYIRTMMMFSLAVGLFVFVCSSYMVYMLSRKAEAHRRDAERAEHELRWLSSMLVHAQEQERRLLSRELHDEVGQTLTALGIELGNLDKLRDGPDYEFHEHVGEAKRLTQETMRTVRELAMGLRPAMLDDSGLAPSVRYQARQFTRRIGIPVSVEIDGILHHLPDAHRTCVYRVIQEALTNCARHAGAEHIQIALHGRKDTVSLLVRDDGVGFPESFSSGMGLIGIEERARELGGRVYIQSAADRGTLLWLELPLPPEPAGA
jgi:signal transduction histidine kinase